MSPSQSHLDTRAIMSTVQTSMQHETRTQHLLNDVPDSIRLRLPSQEPGPDPFAQKKSRQSAHMEQSENVSFVDAAVMLSESSCALEMVQPCSGEAQSKFRGSFLRDPGTSASAAARKNLEVKNTTAGFVSEGGDQISQ